jgi:hypothetical protein
MSGVRDAGHREPNHPMRISRIRRIRRQHPGKIGELLTEELQQLSIRMVMIEGHQNPSVEAPRTARGWTAEDS